MEKNGMGVNLFGRIVLDAILRDLGCGAAHWVGLACQASVVAVTVLQVL